MDVQLALAQHIHSACTGTLVRMTVVCKHISSHYYAVSESNYKRVTETIPASHGTRLYINRLDAFYKRKLKDGTLSRYRFSVFVLPSDFGRHRTHYVSMYPISASTVFHRIPQIIALPYVMEWHGREIKERFKFFLTATFDNRDPPRPRTACIAYVTERKLGTTRNTGKHDMLDTLTFEDSGDRLVEVYVGATDGRAIYDNWRLSYLIKDIIMTYTVVGEEKGL